MTNNTGKKQKNDTPAVKVGAKDVVPQKVPEREFSWKDFFSAPVSWMWSSSSAPARKAEESGPLRRKYQPGIAEKTAKQYEKDNQVSTKNINTMEWIRRNRRTKAIGGYIRKYGLSKEDAEYLAGSVNEWKKENAPDKAFSGPHVRVNGKEYKDVNAYIQAHRKEQEAQQSAAKAAERQQRIDSLNRGIETRRGRINAWITAAGAQYGVSRKDAEGKDMSDKDYASAVMSHLQGMAADPWEAYKSKLIREQDSKKAYGQNAPVSVSYLNGRTADPEPVRPGPLVYHGPVSVQQYAADRAAHARGRADWSAWNSRENKRKQEESEARSTWLLRGGYAEMAKARAAQRVLNRVNMAQARILDNIGELGSMGITYGNPAQPQPQPQPQPATAPEKQKNVA